MKKRLSRRVADMFLCIAQGLDEDWPTVPWAGYSMIPLLNTQLKPYFLFKYLALKTNSFRVQGYQD